MSRYLVIWEANPDQMPTDPTERATLMAQTKEKVKD